MSWTTTLNHSRIDGSSSPDCPGTLRLRLNSAICGIALIGVLEPECTVEGLHQLVQAAIARVNATWGSSH